VPRWGDRRRIRIGLLGGSFNPAHAGHLHVAELALRRLRLDQVWLMVSPGNPLKEKRGMASMAERMASAHAIACRSLAGGGRILATGIEAALHTRYTVDTLRILRIRFPRARFVWLMGADNLEQLPAWNEWLEIARHSSFAVFPRPTYNHRALAGQASQRLRPARRVAHMAPALAGLRPPAWVFLPARQNHESATAIRARRSGVNDHRPQAAPTANSPGRAARR
jgi:nicotinate-nucleotide adenylyltransferase